jgi:hypothetical protein
MKNFSTLIFTLLIGAVAFAQPTELSHPKYSATHAAPSWLGEEVKAPGDSCGAYFNNYIGLGKTTDLYFEGMRTGDVSDFNPYPGRAQRFHANQPIEVSGIQFYGFQTNESIDSIMVITILYDYIAVTDTVGAELARDTVYVKHTTFTPVLPELEVNSFFDEPVLVTQDYVIAVITETNDSLKILTSSAPDADGEGEGVSFAYYNNPAAPSFTGWYPTLPTFGPSYDLDYLISPLVKFKLQDGFDLLTDEVCPSIVSAACVAYDQQPIYADIHYNRNAATPNLRVNWAWGDGLQNTLLTELCHTYDSSGDYGITLRDSLNRYVFSSPYCSFNLTETVVVLDSTIADFTASISGLTVTVTDLSVNADSIFVNYGDGSVGTNETESTHSYDVVDTYTIWVYAYGPCNTDSMMIAVDASDVGIEQLNYSVDIYPNPANNNVTVKGPSGTYAVEILNILGEIVLAQGPLYGTAQFNTSDFTAGTYFIAITSDAGRTTKKLVVKH